MEINEKLLRPYEPQETEKRIYKLWEESGFFNPDNLPGERKEPFTIIMPPPNVTGILHMGHALMITLEDIMIRYKRMQGFKTLWLPGTDHAAIATQSKVEGEIKKKEGKSRHDLGREEMLKRIEEFAKQSHDIIISQIKVMGASCDWSREAFTLDDKRNIAVNTIFKKMYDDGLIYRGNRIVNWDPKGQTTISDDEIVYEERKAKFYTFKYSKDFPISISTSRPETKIGDVAVAVHPEDARYKKYIGKTYTIEDFCGTKLEIKIIADKEVDPLFGTGALGVTPAHSMIDWEMAERHNLPKDKIVIDEKSRMTVGDDKILGKKVVEAREVIVEWLKTEGLLEKEENITHQVPVCYKCKNAIEPLLMDQWFVEMQPLAKDAIEAVKTGDIKIYPQSFEKMYFQFLENIRDWNISRQIVWGIQIPAWSCKKCHEWTVTSGEVPQECKCGSKELVRDLDVFDTWFSSGQWPYATLKTTDSLEFYPTTVMETGYDILRWWVARMVMLGIYIQKKNGVGELSKQIPFQNIVLHGLVNDPLGKKMSKSKGNVVNPMEIVDQYGADAIRFALVYGTALGNDQVLSYPKLEAMKKFSNKLWNMARFIEFARDDFKIHKDRTVLPQTPGWSDDWSKKVQALVNEVTKYLELYQFNYAADRLYEFTWHEFADSYIENIKVRMTKESLKTLEENFMIILKLLHPFMPFITEEINNRLYGGENNLIISRWPTAE